MEDEKIWVKAELGFDESAYTALDTRQLKKEASNTSQFLHTQLGLLCPNTNDLESSPEGGGYNKETDCCQINASNYWGIHWRLCVLSHYYCHSD